MSGMLSESAWRELLRQRDIEIARLCVEWRDEVREIDRLSTELGKAHSNNARLRKLLDAARICLKNRDRSEHEADVYTAICEALE
jgi:hypothetical protein